MSKGIKILHKVDTSPFIKGEFNAMHNRIPLSRRHNKGLGTQSITNRTDILADSRDHRSPSVVLKSTSKL